MINKIVGKTNDKTCIISKISVGTVEFTKSSEILNSLGNHFAHISKEYATKIGNEVPIRKYLAKIPKNHKSIFIEPTTTTEILRIIDNLPNKISSGWDAISNRTLKNLKLSLVEPMCIIFNNSLRSGVFPDLMKLANVVPLFKSGRKDLLNNYRLIFLLITMSKVLEKLMYSHTYSFLTNTRQLFCGQYGFRKNHSCEHAVQELCGNVLKGFEKKECTIGIFMDLSKAFNTLEHDVPGC